MKVYKLDLEREINDAQWAEYSAAGWTQATGSKVVVEKADEVINLKPAAKVKAAVEQANDDTITTQGEE